MNDVVLPGQAPRVESEPSLANIAAQPMGVIRRNLKMQVYLGIAVLFIIATAVSSVHHKTPANKLDPNTPPSPMVQDESAANIEEMRREIAKQQQETGRLATGAMPLAVPTQTSSMPYGPNGVPVNALPGTQYAQETTHPATATGASLRYTGEGIGLQSSIRFKPRL
jgi:hypothetical protein